MQWDEKLTQRGVVLHKAAFVAEWTWKLIHAEFIGEHDVHELGGRRHIHVDVVNEDGKRMIGLAVRIWWPRPGGTREERVPIEEKPGEQAGGSFVLSASGHAYSAAVANGLPSDAVSGMGLGSIEQPHMGIHVAYLFRWQRTRRTEGPEPPTQPTDDNTLAQVRVNIRGMRALLNDTERLLEEA